MPHLQNDKDIKTSVRNELRAIAPYCHWTGGVWPSADDEPARAWNDFDNTPKSIKALTSKLIKIYYGRVVE
jgi:hypothetical protein